MLDVTCWENEFRGRSALGKEAQSKASEVTVVTAKADLPVFTASCVGKCQYILGDLRSHLAHFADVSRGPRTWPSPRG